LDTYERLAENEFESFYQSLASNRYGLSVTSPSEFEMNLSAYVLKKAQNMLQKLTDYETCQGATEDISYVEIVPALIEYYKNVATLVNEFREKYARFKDELSVGVEAADSVI
jgi:hypothetical protein